MSLFPKTNLLVFCAYLIRIEKRNNFVEDFFFAFAFLTIYEENFKTFQENSLANLKKIIQT
jgi:hypothetical protein